MKTIRLLLECAWLGAASAIARLHSPLWHLCAYCNKGLGGNPRSKDISHGMCVRCYFRVVRAMLFLFALAFPLMGCNTLRRVLPVHAGQESSGVSAPPDVYTITGVTDVDFKLVQPVRVLDSTVAVRVKAPGAADWHLCNAYEVKLDTTGVGGGGVSFRRRADVSYAYDGVTVVGITFYPAPVAPTGTRYEITSQINVHSHDLY